MIPISMKPFITCVDNEQKREEMVSASELCREVPMLNHVSFYSKKRVIDYPMLRKLNEASMFETSQSFVKIRKSNDKKLPLDTTEMVLLPFTQVFGTISHLFAGNGIHLIWILC